MSDIEESVATDGVGAGEETAVTTETPAPEAKETPQETKSEPTIQEKIAELAAQKASKEGDKTAVTDGKTTETPAYEPNFKFNVLDKQHEIPKEFQSLIKDKDSEKMVREIFEKAYGLDSVKTKATEVRNERDNLSQENTAIKQSMDSLRAIYQGAVSSGNFMKLDDFFARLKIPEQHIMQYALAKVQFSNLPPDQQQLMRGNLDAEKRAEEVSQQANQHLSEAQQARSELIKVQLDYTMTKPDVRSIADQFDAQAGKPGAFRQQVINVANLHYLQRRIDLTPEQATQIVIQDLGLKAPAATAVPAAPGTTTQQTPPAGKVIVRETKTIPNIQGRSSSPLKKSPRSIADLKELSRQAQEA